MKSLILAVSFLAASVSFAQLSNVEGKKYRQYKVETANESGIITMAYLQVNAETEDYSYGDAHIPGHGFLESRITGSVIENGKSCDFSSVYFQAKFDDSQKFNTVVKLCSGLVLEFHSTEGLLENKHTAAIVRNLKVGTTNAIGIALVSFEGLKEIIKEIPTDRR